ncbi:MAG TPA: DNA replication/repair protein RecF [Acidimicrobiia bacterium]|nr:DNA replication/repair protein RecF [Acidimicrobiia bacterium]
MQVDWLSLSDFRSYETLEWSPEPGVNLLLGPNGAGKTNLLEAIAFLGTLRSFRSVDESSLIKDGVDAAIMRVGISMSDRTRLVEIELNRSGPRRAQVDKTRLRRTSDLLGVVRVIAFLPEDLDLVKRGPAYRRDLIDQVALQLWPAAHLDQMEFDRALRQRNAFLRAGERDEATLSVWDSRFAQSGGRVMARRVAVLETLGPWLEETYGSISQKDDRASLGYVASWTSREIDTSSAGEFAAEITSALERSRKADYDRRLTTTGPHRDEPVFRIDGVETRTHGSQGEQRTMALAVKLAAHRAVADVVGEQPVLLLDDVFSELDPLRAKALAGAIPEQAQTLITSARPEDVPVPGAVWRVGDGVHR